MSIISVKNLNKSFQVGKEKVHVLKDINLEIQKGEFISIMGPSGGGKSTLLYLLGGLDKPTSGKVILDNKDLGKIKQKEMSKIRRTKVGFVFQFYNLVPNLSVEDNIMLPIILDGKKVRDYKDKLEEILDIIGMKEKRKMTPRELSGGQQQRVAIARALVFDPDIIFLDEPIGNLDSKTGTDIMQLFKKINKQYGKTLVQVTHSYESALYGTSIVKLIDGQIVGREEVVDESEAS
ncbi:ABC transporter ATP-binding protein [Clostridium sp. HCP1S3_B4]|uniref:ABC transporter ATP-binding protein n=1 Tax=unclassified Clostridium TaxID=2614128 RepID=UPI0016BC9A10|nr:ABC transporter ATP-binding protein [Clostridiales bacterium]MDY2729879.1 ABC transporter ATP-binding protein [Clostridium sp.]NLK22777.1 ABC transporter ATP-binding protein [Clostridiales bacterium]